MLTEACCSPGAAHASSFMSKAGAGARAGKQEDAGSDATLSDVNNFNSDN
jgi:hypothetical protein